MRKAVSVLLAIILAFSFSSAFAKRMDYQPARGNIMKFEDFKSYFTDMMTDYGYNPDWTSMPRSDGDYQVYQVRIDSVDEGTVDLDIYTENGNIAFFVSHGSVYKDEGDSVDHLQWLLDCTRLASYSTFCILYLEDYKNGGNHTPEEMVSVAAQDWDNLIAGLEEDTGHTDFSEGAYVMDVLGCPVGITIYVDGCYIEMSVCIMNKNGIVWTE